MPSKLTDDAANPPVSSAIPIISDILGMSKTGLILKNIYLYCVEQLHYSLRKICQNVL